MATRSVNALTALSKRLKNIETELVEKEFCGLIYGDKGTGKTTAAHGLAQLLKGDGRILRLDSSDGWVSLDNIPSLKRDTLNLEDATIQDLAEVADALLQRKPGFEDITVVVLDEVSTWYIDMLHAYVREQMNIAPNEPLPPFGWDYYGPVQAALGEVLKKFHRTKGLHVIMIAHEQERALKGDKNAKRLVPSMGTKLADTLGQIAHVVARFESRQVQQNYVREAQSWPTRSADAKCRIKGIDLKMPVTKWVQTIARWVEDGRMEEPDTPVEATGDEEPDDEDYEVDDED